MPASNNLIRVAQALASIREERFVFVGASILPLLLNDPAAPPARFTNDVDAVVDVLTYEHWERLQSRMHDCGLVVRADAAVGKGRICLFHLVEIEVDIMPVRFPLLMRPSRMLELGFQYAELYRLTEELEIQALSAPGLLAAKLEAFRDRGVREFPVSKDLDDIVALLDRRLDIGSEVRAAPVEMRYFIAVSMNRLLDDGQAADVIRDMLRDSDRERRVFDLMRILSSTNAGG
jgi:predicted nucleotidyltransferase